METSLEISFEWPFDKLVSAATYSVRYMAKLGQIALEEASLNDSTPQRTSAESERKVCVKEPEITKCSFQDLPVSGSKNIPKTGKLLKMHFYMFSRSGKNVRTLPNFCF